MLFNWLKNKKAKSIVVAGVNNWMDGDVLSITANVLEGSFVVSGFVSFEGPQKESSTRVQIVGLLIDDKPVRKIKSGETANVMIRASRKKLEKIDVGMTGF